MKMCKCKNLLLAGCLLLLLLLTSCIEPQQEQVEITIIHGWGSTEPDHVAMRSIYSDFQKDNPDVKLNLISMPNKEEMIRKAEDLIMVGNTPDVIFLGGVGSNTIYNFMVENKLALDFMPYINEDEVFKSQIAPSNLEFWKTETGELFTVSDVRSLSGGYWYNEEIFSQAGISDLPETWEEFEAACGKIEEWAGRKQNGVKPLQISKEGYLYFADHMLARNGGIGEASIKEHKLVLDDAELAKVIIDLNKIFEFSVIRSENYSYRDEQDLFNEGKLAIYINGVWGAPMIAEDMDVKYALFPSGEGNTLSCESTGLGYILGAGSDEAKRNASVRFVKYMLSDEVQQRILLETEQVPANRNILIEDYRTEMERFYQAVKVVQSADEKIEIPENLWGNEWKSVFEEYILQLLSGEISQDEFYNYFKSKYNPIK